MSEVQEAMNRLFAQGREHTYLNGFLVDKIIGKAMQDKRLCEEAKNQAVEKRE